MDDHLRDLERRFEASGAPGDGAHLLRARLRAGALDAEALDLAAELGDASALLTLDRLPLDPTSVHPWHAGVRAALARRLLWRPDAPLPAPHLVSIGVGPRRPSALRAELTGHDPWELRSEVDLPSSATVIRLLLRASRAAFRDLGEMWAELALPHHVVTNAPAGETSVQRVRRYLASDEAAATPRSALRTFDLEVQLGLPGASGLRTLWPGSAPRVAWTLARTRFELHSVAETDRDLFVYFHETI